MRLEKNDDTPLHMVRLPYSNAPARLGVFDWVERDVCHAYSRRGGCRWRCRCRRRTEGWSISTQTKSSVKDRDAVVLRPKKNQEECESIGSMAPGGVAVEALHWRALSHD